MSTKSDRIDYRLRIRPDDLPRLQVRVLPNKGPKAWKDGNRWRVTVDGETVETFKGKGGAVRYARQRALEAWRGNSRPSQMTVHGLDGKVQREHTYGRDPERYVG